MHGSVNYQINRIFTESGIFRPGEKKHADKDAAKRSLKSENKTATSQRIAARTKLHSYQTGRDYKDTWHKMGHHAREMGLKDMTKMSGLHVTNYLEGRIADGVAHGTWKKEAAHLSKLGNALGLFSGSTFDFQTPINELRDLAKDTLLTPHKERGFVEPRAVISGMKNPTNQLIAAVQLEGGARVHEVTQIRADQLRGDNRIWLTNTKGGKPRAITVGHKTYQILERLTEKGPIQVSQAAYRADVYRAAERSGEPNTGTHDFRYCYAQGRYMDLTKQGHVPEQAHQIISWEMGHERADITSLYL